MMDRRKVAAAVVIALDSCCAVQLFLLEGFYFNAARVGDEGKEGPA